TRRRSRARSLPRATRAATRAAPRRSSRDQALELGDGAVQLVGQWRVKPLVEDRGERPVVPELTLGVLLVEPFPQAVAEAAVVGDDAPGVVQLVGAGHDQRSLGRLAQML